MRILLASVCILLASATSEAQEAVHLEDLEKARVGDVEIGPRGSLGHGLSSGSMGWSFGAAPLTWFGTVGGFARLALR